MPELKWHSNSPEETDAIAARMAKAMRGGEIVSLEGDLGAGKTRFARAFARALGVREPVTSPTFVIQKIYETGGRPVGRILHYDAYRLESYAELLDLGFEDAGMDSVSLVEWGDKFVEQFPPPVIRVRMDYVGDESRVVRVTVRGDDEVAARLGILNSES